MATLNELLKRNEKLATTHQPIPTFAELAEMKIESPHTALGVKSFGMPPIIHLLIQSVTCADPRCHPEGFLDLTPADGIIIFRNVGGHVKYALNDIVALDTFLGLKEIIVVHHTDCGTSHFKDESIREKLSARLPERHDEIAAMSFGAITDLEQSVRDDLAILRASPFIRKELAQESIGFVYNLKTGELSKVE